MTQTTFVAVVMTDTTLNHMIKSAHRLMMIKFAAVKASSTCVCSSVGGSSVVGMGRASLEVMRWVGVGESPAVGCHETVVWVPAPLVVVGHSRRPPCRGSSGPPNKLESISIISTVQ